jgi:hypothetical protein
MFMKVSHTMTTLNTLLKYVIFAMCLVVNSANAAEHANSSDSLTVLDYLTDKDGKYAGPTVEDNVKLMDTDKNGFADVLEVRAFLQLKHGKDYQKELLDGWESAAYGKSCSSPFAKALYSDKDYNDSSFLEKTNLEK